MIADGGGAIALRIELGDIAAGEVHELPHAVPLLATPTGMLRRVVADRGYASHCFREHIWGTCPEWISDNRNIVERPWARPKEWRSVATRYEKTVASFAGLLHLAATMGWLCNDGPLSTLCCNG